MCGVDVTQSHTGPILVFDFPSRLMLKGKHERLFKALLHLCVYSLRWTFSQVLKLLFYAHLYYHSTTFSEHMLGLRDIRKTCDVR